MGRFNASVLGPTQTATRAAGSGIWTPDSARQFSLDGNWPGQAPIWNHNPMGDFDTYNLSGSITQNSTQVYLTGASYDGGVKGYFAADNNPGLALQNSWHLDAVTNRDGNDANPYPYFTLEISRSASANSFYNNNYEIARIYIGNSRGYGGYVLNSSGTTLSSKTESGSSYAAANCAHRIKFDATTFTFYFYRNTTASFDNMNLWHSYQLTEAQKTAMLSSYENENYYIGGELRANNDGWKDVRWYTI